MLVYHHFLNWKRKYLIHFVVDISIVKRVEGLKVFILHVHVHVQVDVVVRRKEGHRRHCGRLQRRRISLSYPILIPPEERPISVGQSWSIQPRRSVQRISLWSGLRSCPDYRHRRRRHKRTFRWSDVGWVSVDRSRSEQCEGIRHMWSVVFRLTKRYDPERGHARGNGRCWRRVTWPGALHPGVRLVRAHVDPLQTFGRFMLKNSDVTMLLSVKTI